MLSLMPNYGKADPICGVPIWELSEDSIIIMYHKRVRSTLTSHITPTLESGRDAGATRNIPS